MSKGKQAFHEDFISTQVDPLAPDQTVEFNIASVEVGLGEGIDELTDDDLLKLLRALERAERFIQNEPAKAQAILRTRLQTN